MTVAATGEFEAVVLGTYTLWAVSGSLTEFGGGEVPKLVQYIVRQGDYLEKVAFKTRCTPEKIWDEPKNKQVRDLRGDGRILCPGDLLWVPCNEPNMLPFKAGEVNTYVVRVPKVPVHLILHSEDEPLADEPYIVEEVDSSKILRTGSDGSANFEVPVHLPRITLYLPNRQRRFAFALGGLDPLEVRTGILQRLVNLGYLRTTEDVSSEALDSAIREFQTDEGLAVTGEIDDPTRNALRSSHHS